MTRVFDRSTDSRTNFMIDTPGFDFRLILRTKLLIRARIWLVKKYIKVSNLYSRVCLPVSPTACLVGEQVKLPFCRAILFIENGV